MKVSSGEVRLIRRWVTKPWRSSGQIVPMSCAVSFSMSEMVVRSFLSSPDPSVLSFQKTYDEVESFVIPINQFIHVLLREVVIVFKQVSQCAELMLCSVAEVPLRPLSLVEIPSELIDPIRAPTGNSWV